MAVPRFLFIISVPGALLRVDGEHKHQGIQCIIRIPHIDHIGIRHVEQLLADHRYQIRSSIQDTVIPLHDGTLDVPAVIIDVVLRLQKGEFLTETAHTDPMLIKLELRQELQHMLHDHPYLTPTGIINHQLMSPGQLSLHHINRVSRLIIDIITVKPGKESLFK